MLVYNKPLYDPSTTYPILEYISEKRNKIINDYENHTCPSPCISHLCQEDTLIIESHENLSCLPLPRETLIEKNIQPLSIPLLVIKSF